MRIASASTDHSAKVWDAYTGREVATFTGMWLMFGAWYSARTASG